MTVTVDVAGILGQLPAQPLAAMRVLRLVDDPDASAADLGEVIALDPVMSARVMRLANSAYYAGRAPVSSAGRAVILLGFSTVRAIAAAAACGLLAADVSLGPADFWAHSVAVGVASGASAEVLGIQPGEAFTAGLLHDLGTAVLHGYRPAFYETSEPIAEADLLGAEREAFGVDHAAAGAIALEAWRFPASLVDAVASHHEEHLPADPLSRALALGQAVAAHLDDEGEPEPSDDLARVAGALRLGGAVVARLLDESRHECTRLASRIGGVL